MDERKYTVYMHTNKANNKVYVGITKQEPNARWKNGKGYIEKKKDNTYIQDKFAKAILKYGWEGFEHIIWATNLTYDEACHAEKILIALYDTIKNGYNIRSGGNAKSTMPEETLKKMSEVKMGSKNPMWGRIASEEYRAKRGKKVAQYDVDGNLIKIWDYMSQAARSLEIAKTAISGCCRNIYGYRTAGGFVWKFVE